MKSESNLESPVVTALVDLWYQKPTNRQY